jgi:DNA-binding LacI/PurR family transcriptional regulator
MPSRPTATPPLPRRHSLVAQTVESLRAGIRSGYWREHLPGERELCEHLEVSRRTIGAALHELERQGWIEVAQRQRRRIARRRASAAPSAARRSIVILSASPVQGMPQQTLVMMDALKERLTKAGYALDFQVSSACFTAHPARALQKLVAEKPASVWLQLGSADPTQQWFAEKGIPCLLLGTGHSESALPSVDSDHRAACRHAGGVLLGRGHLRIAIVLPQGRRGGDMASEEGVRQAIGRHRGRSCACSGTTAPPHTSAPCSIAPCANPHRPPPISSRAPSTRSL